MNIAWFTPWCRNSAIGRYSGLVVCELVKAHNVTLWAPDLPTNRVAPVPLVTFSSCTEKDIKILAEDYDIAVYNIGNYYPYHGLIYQFSKRLPGLVILHDIVLHHFFASLYLEHLTDLPAYLSELTRLYGTEARSAAEVAMGGRRRSVWESDDVARWPFFEAAIEGAAGVVTHSEDARKQVESRFPGPVFRLSLPYNKGQSTAAEEHTKASGKILLLSIGHVNRNRRIHTVLNALASCVSRDRVQFIIAGPYDPSYKAECDEIVAAAGLQRTVQFLGRVDDPVLHNLLTKADICVNLRFPVTETGSASLAEEMLHGKPVIVTNSGCYADVPDDCVAKVSIENEQEDLVLVLSRLIGDQDIRTELAKRAKNFAEEHFSPARYAAGLTPVLADVCTAAPLLTSVDRLSAVLRSMGVTPEMRICDTVSAEFAMLFGIAHDNG